MAEQLAHWVNPAVTQDNVFSTVCVPVGSCRSASVAIRATLETCGRSRGEVSGQTKTRTSFERSVCRMLCQRDITLEAGQAIVAPDRREEYQRFSKPEK